MDAIGLIGIGAGLAVLTGFGAAAIGMGLAAAKALEAVGRQPEASGKISSTLLLSLAIIESTAIYGFVISLIMIFYHDEQMITVMRNMKRRTRTRQGRG